MLVKVRNAGNKIFMQNGKWLGKGEEATIPSEHAHLLLQINPNITIVEEQTKRKRK